MKIRFLKLAQSEVDEAVAGIDSKTIIVVAVAHLHREPRYWIDRIVGQK